MNTLETARSWTQNGFSVIPIGWRSKRPAFDALKAVGSVNDAGKPVWEPYKTRRATDSELWQWFAGPQRNLGVVTGWAGLVVLDFDIRDAYDAWMGWAAAESKRAAAMSATTYRVFSARGVHVYLIVEEIVESYNVPGIDVKAAWGYVLTPPSVHPSGHRYTSRGNVISRCARLTDVFPFEKPEPASEMLEVVQTQDPYDAASRAVECGEGAIAAAKRRVVISDLVTVVSRDRGGAWALCPLHRDTNPSLRIYNDDRWYCFGCRAHGDALDLHAAIHKQTLRETIAELAEAS